MATSCNITCDPRVTIGDCPPSPMPEKTCTSSYGGYSTCPCVTHAVRCAGWPWFAPYLFSLVGGLDTTYVLYPVIVHTGPAYELVTDTWRSDSFASGGKVWYWELVISGTPPNDSTISAGNIALRQVFTTAPSGHPADFKWVNRTDYATANQPGSVSIPLNMPDDDAYLVDRVGYLLSDYPCIKNLYLHSHSAVTWPGWHINHIKIATQVVSISWPVPVTGNLVSGGSTWTAADQMTWLEGWLRWAHEWRLWAGDLVGFGSLVLRDDSYTDATPDGFWRLPFMPGPPPGTFRERDSTRVRVSTTGQPARPAPWSTSWPSSHNTDTTAGVGAPAGYSIQAFCRDATYGPHLRSSGAGSVSRFNPGDPLPPVDYGPYEFNFGGNAGAPGSSGQGTVRYSIRYSVTDYGFLDDDDPIPPA